MTRDQWRSAIMSILIGTAIAAATQIVDALLQVLKVHFLDVAGTGAGIVYWLKSRKVA